MAKQVKQDPDKNPDVETIEDGHGGAWVNWCKDCRLHSLEIVRPGKVQCGKCGK